MTGGQRTPRRVTFRVEAGVGEVFGPDTFAGQVGHLVPLDLQPLDPAPFGCLIEALVADDARSVMLTVEVAPVEVTGGAPAPAALAAALGHAAAVIREQSATWHRLGQLDAQWVAAADACYDTDLGRACAGTLRECAAQMRAAAMGPDAGGELRRIDEAVADLGPQFSDTAGRTTRIVHAHAPGQPCRPACEPAFEFGHGGQDERSAAEVADDLFEAAFDTRPGGTRRGPDPRGAIESDDPDTETRP